MTLGIDIKGYSDSGTQSQALQGPNVTDKVDAGSDRENFDEIGEIDEISEIDEIDEISDTDIAIIGMAGRFPGADSVDTFWQNIREGREAVQFFSDEAVRAAGVPSFILQDPNYVKASAVLEGIESFDAAFFGFSPREAEMMDPQHRLFLEQAWTVLEHAGYDPDQYEGAIAVYAGVGINGYLLTSLYPRMQQAGGAMNYQAIIRNDKDFLPTLVSYKLNLKGPSVTIQTACSTSLVAVHMACQSLLNGECDMALAGASSINVNQKQGYLYEEGMILSPDGHCRAFDAEARGTVSGSGVATILLKRLSDAMEDGDTIHAVIKGSAINNDGNAKVGYTAPSVSGQASVIAEAQAIAGVNANSISYIETHGTGTILGDPIEISALTQAFQNSTQSTQVDAPFCALGSVKTNIGHLDTVSGMAGLIKTALALRQRQLPPSLHFKSPNPAINFSNSPFYVNTQLTDWPRQDTRRRAGVSSFGIGGTNAHVVMEEAPSLPHSEPSRTAQIIGLSAKTPTALTQIADNLLTFLQEQPTATLSLADVAYTLNRGRKGLDYRRTLVAQNPAEAIATLQEWLIQPPFSPSRAENGVSVAFMFSGQGSQYVNMGRDLYEEEPDFRATIDHCATLLFPLLGEDLCALIYPPANASLEHLASCTEKLNQTALTQPALFMVEYALAKLWMAWGIQPQAMIGHSIGEYVAASLAGVFSLEDGLKLVAMRGKLMQSMPAGSMLAIALPAADVTSLLQDYADLSLATVNGASCVVSGSTESIKTLHHALQNSPLPPACSLLHTSHGFHSVMMEPILPTFIHQVQTTPLHPPSLPYLSNVTGTWISEEEATDPHYWAKHLREPVQFAAGIEQLLQDSNVILLEVGPGRTLSQLVKQHPAWQRGHDSHHNHQNHQNHLSLTSLPHPKESISALPFILQTLGQLWSEGGSVNWQAFYAHEQRRRLPLPTYPFERQRYWIEAAEATASGSDGFEAVNGSSGGFDLQKFRTVPRQPQVSDWLYVPSWRRSQLPPPICANSPLVAAPATWLVFLDDCGVGHQLGQQLEALGQSVWIVVCGVEWGLVGDRTITINPENPDDFDQLVQYLRSQNQHPAKVLHCWSLTNPQTPALDLHQLHHTQTLGMHTLLALAKSLGKQPTFPDTEFIALVNGIHDVTGEETTFPTKATLLAPIKVLPLEYSALKCRSIDIVLPSNQPINQPINQLMDQPIDHSSLPLTKQLIDQLMAEFAEPCEDVDIAYRGRSRWVPTYAPARSPQRLQSAEISKVEDLAPSPRLRPQGVYIITGGLGGIGLTLAQYLATTVQARLVLVKRTDFLPRQQWQSWLDTHELEDATAQTIHRLQAIEAAGGVVQVVAGDVTSLAAMTAVVKTAEAEFGAIHGVIHCAGVADFAGIVQGRTRSESDRIMASKLQGTLVLHQALAHHLLDFFILSSSLSATLYKTLFGQVAYCAANDFLDAFAIHQTATSQTFTLAIDWTEWFEVGMASKSHAQRNESASSMADQLPLDDIILGMTPSEGQAAFHHLLKQSEPRIVVSTQDLSALLRQQVAFDPHEFLRQFVLQAPDPNATQYPRPELGVAYVPPQTPVEFLLAQLWQSFLGLESVGMADNFFDLGGDSLISLGLVAQLQNKLGIELASSVLLENATLTELVRHLEVNYPEAISSLAAAESSAPVSDTSVTTETPLASPAETENSLLSLTITDSTVVDTAVVNTAVVNTTVVKPAVVDSTVVKPAAVKSAVITQPPNFTTSLIQMRRGEATQSPLFFAHPIGGGVACYTDVLRFLDPQRPFYGLRAVGMDDDQAPHTDIRVMAQGYIDAIKSIQPEGPYYLGGWSMGGVIAYEIAQQLGQNVATVILIDSPAPVQQDEPDPLLTQLFVFARSLGIPDDHAKMVTMSERLHSSPVSEKLKPILNMAWTLKLLPQSFDLQKLAVLFTVFSSNNYALKRYVATPDRTRSPMLFVQAEDTSSLITSEQDQLGWEQLVGGDRVSFTRSPGDHYSMVTKPNAQSLGNCIEAHLRSLRHLAYSRC